MTASLVYHQICISVASVRNIKIIIKIIFPVPLFGIILNINIVIYDIHIVKRPIDIGQRIIIHHRPIYANIPTSNPTPVSAIETTINERIANNKYFKNLIIGFVVFPLLLSVISSDVVSSNHSQQCLHFLASL
jgi:hypothetical protein